MSYAQRLEKGMSLSFFPSAAGQAIRRAAAAGIRCVELSYGYDYYFNGIDFPHNAAAIGEDAALAGVRINSLHIPFSGYLDISNESRELRDITLYTDLSLIRSAPQAGVKVIVLHPSSEPISPEKREERMRLSRDAIIMLNAECEKLGLKLAVENLPRTCLCRTSEEMIRLLSGTGAGVVFDTNHSLTEENPHFIDALTAAGIKIHTLHISDYYRDANGALDERHCLPGDGVNDWRGIFAALERHGYSGPLMYEISGAAKHNGEPVTAETIAESMTRIAN